MNTEERRDHNGVVRELKDTETQLRWANKRIEELEQARRRVPNDDGGPGREDTYWLRTKLQAAIQHLRDVEDYYRFLGGEPQGFNMIRADRARDLYETILEDFVNGKISRPTRAELERALRTCAGAWANVYEEAVVGNGTQTVSEFVATVLPA